ncbi:MAG: CaiB/BaiF CoA-transferase family protein [Steroidobacteraceae bacterium]
MGPLAGVRVVELAGLGPAPICGMLLADLGAEVIRVERATAKQGEAPPIDPLLRNRRSIALNFKHPRGVEVLLSLVARADILIEGFRPGVTERLGIGPEPCLARNPKLVYGRMTGWGQEGPLAQAAAHDINYVALTGLLHQVGTPGGKPVPPLYFTGDFGAGGAMLAFGVLAALTEARHSGRGQVVDAAIVDGAIAMMGVLYALRHTPLVRDAPGENYLAGAAPWYDTYACSDGRYVSVGPLEPQFFGLLLDKLGLERARWAPLGFPAVDDAARARWPELRAAMATAFATRTRAEWCRELEGTDACFAPVLSMEEAPRHPHNLARGAFIEVDGVQQNAPAPRFSRTPSAPVRAPVPAGADTAAVLRDAGYDAAQIEQLRASGALA